MHSTSCVGTPSQHAGVTRMTLRPGPPGRYLAMAARIPGAAALASRLLLSSRRGASSRQWQTRRETGTQSRGSGET
jgi:hypothetical protein